jgi:hypothetical protein
MLGNHTSIVRFPFGALVARDTEPFRVGRITKVDEPPFTVEVLWEDEVVPEVVWSNRLILVSA